MVDQLAPGGFLAWTVTGSGLGGIADLRLLDDLGDGQRMDTLFRPQVVIRRGSTTLFSGELLGWSGVRSAETAVTAIDFDLAPTLRAMGLPGGLTDDSTVEVTFRSQILSIYAARQPPPLGRLLVQGDPLHNNARFTGTVAGHLASSDAVATRLALLTSVLRTSIFAVNGAPVVGVPQAAFGDIVTYRMQLQLPLTSARQVQLVVTAPGLADMFVFDAAGNAVAPPSFHAQFGPSGSYTATRPLVTYGTDSNGRATLRFDFGDVQPVYGNGPGTIDLLFSAPLQPGAPLTVQATETETNSFSNEVSATAPPIGLTLIEPALRLQTATLYASNEHATWTGTGGPFGYSPDFGQFGGLISSAGLAFEPFADRLSGVDAGDDVTFVIAVENRTGAAAFDVIIRDQLPEGFEVPPEGASIVVTDGAGTPLDWTGNLFDAAGGLRLVGKLAGYDADNGLNVLLITYTLRTTDRLDLSAPVRGNLARIVGYATQPGWADRVPSTLASDVTVITQVVGLPHTVAIALVATDLPATTGALLALGETATFLLTARLAEGLSRGLELALELPPGFIAVSARVISLGANIVAQQQTATAGRIVFGDTFNMADGWDTAADLVQIEVTMRATNTPAGPAPHQGIIQGAVSIGGPNQPRAVSLAATPALVTVAQPVAPILSMGPTNVTLRNGQAATFTATITLPTGTSNAFRIQHRLPAGLGYITGSVRIIQAGGITSGAPASSLTLSTPTVLVEDGLLTLDFGQVTAPAGADRRVVVEVQARVTGAVGQSLVSAVTVETGYATSAVATVVTLVGNTAPIITGHPTSAATRDDTALAVFTGLIVADPDAGQAQTLRITVGTPANGTLTNLGAGRYDAASGIYTVTGSAAEVSLAAAALRFVPTRRQAAVGQQVLTDFSVQATDVGSAASTANFIRVATTIANTAPLIRNAVPCRLALPGTPVRLFTGLLLQDADPGQTETLSIQLTDPTAGVLTGSGPGRYDPATGLFTSTGTIRALMIEANSLMFTASGRPGAGTVEITLVIDDNAGGVARDTSVVALSVAALGGIGPVLPAFIGAASANRVIVNPAGPSVLTATSGRDVFFMDGLAGAQQQAVAGFGDGDSIVLWGFQGGRSSFTWWDGVGPSGHTGRTLRADITGAGSAITSMTFAGKVASDTDRFSISTGRTGGLDYLAIVSSR